MNQLARLSNEWVDDIKCKFEQNEITGTTKLDNSCLIYILSFGRAWVNSCVRVIRMKWQMKEGSKSKLCVWQKLRTFFGLSPFLYCQCFVSQFSAFFNFISPRFQPFRKKNVRLVFPARGQVYTNLGKKDWAGPSFTIHLSLLLYSERLKLSLPL